MLMISVIGIFTEIEKMFKLQTQNIVVCSIDFNSIVNGVLANTVILVYSYITNIESNSDISFASLLDFLEQIILLYVHVRAHSFAKDKVQKVQGRIKDKETKYLRTDLKRAAEF